MPLFKHKASPHREVDAILESIGKGQFDDQMIKELQRIVDTSSDSEVDRVAESLLANIMKTSDTNVLIGTVKALTVMPFLPQGKDQHTIRLMVTMFASPTNTVVTLQHKLLQNEILKFLLSMLKTNSLYAPLMMAELIASLEYAYIAKDADAYPALEKLAMSKPEYFRPHTDTLVKLLGSINKTTRAECAKLIGIIGSRYPEYVSSAMPVLQSLASFYPDAQVKHNASEAYQVLYHGLRLDTIETVAMKEDDKPKQHTAGFADILKKKATDLLSKPPQDMPGERQKAARERIAHERSISARATRNLISRPPDSQETEPESEKVPLSDMEGFESEIKSILDRTRDEFSNDAEGILNSIGIGHLSVKSRDKQMIAAAENHAESNLPSSSGIASQPPQADKPPIHARSSHLDGKVKPRTVAEYAAQSRATANPVKLAHEEKKTEESSPSVSAVHEQHDLPVKAGARASAQGDAKPRNIHVPSGLVKTSAVEKKPESIDTAKLTHTGTKAKQAEPATPIPPASTEEMENPINPEPVKPVETVQPVEIIKPVEAAPLVQEEPIKESTPQKENAPQAKRTERATAGSDKTAAGAPKGLDDPAAKRVEKAIAWFEKVGIPPSPPKSAHHAGTPRQPSVESSKSVPQPQHRTAHANPAPQPSRPQAVQQQPDKAEAHAAHHEVKPAAVPPQQQEAVKTPKTEAVPEKPVQPKHEHKAEPSVLPPKVPATKHEKILPSVSTTQPVTRKIGTPGIGMTDKPLESYGSEEGGKKETVVPGTSISGFGMKRIYKCPRCGARTLAEGELCKVCKMTMERPEEMVCCERCGLMNNRNARFCRKCGAKLENS